MSIEIWNNTGFNNLERIDGYTPDSSGYWRTTAPSGSVNFVPLMPSNDKDFHSSRTRTFFIPPYSSNYTFYIRGDDKALLRAPMNRKCSCPRATRSWTLYREQTCDTVYLEKGLLLSVHILCIGEKAGYKR